MRLLNGSRIVSKLLYTFGWYLWTRKVADAQCFCCTTLRDVIFIKGDFREYYINDLYTTYAVVCWVTAGTDAKTKARPTQGNKARQCACLFRRIGDPNLVDRCLDASVRMYRTTRVSTTNMTIRSDQFKHTWMVCISHLKMPSRGLINGKLTAPCRSYKLLLLRIILWKKSNFINFDQVYRKNISILIPNIYKLWPIKFDSNQKL
jgi:hypothetical protein